MEELKPNGQRAKNAITLIWIVLVLEVASLISGYFQYNLLQSVLNGGEVTIEEANANDTREQLISIVYLIVYIISAITFIQWFRRAYSNLHLKVSSLSFTEGWAAGGWFVPILNLFRPFQIMKELYNETRNLLLEKGFSNYEIISTKFLGWWWALWIINNLIGQFVFRYSIGAESLDSLMVTSIAGMVSNAVGIPLALVAIKVIKDYSSVEPLLTEWSELDGISPENIEYA